MLSVSLSHTHMNIINKSGGNLGGDDCAYSIDHGGGFRVSSYLQIPWVMHIQDELLWTPVRP